MDNIPLVDVINQNYDLLNEHGFCNDLYDIYISENGSIYKIVDLIIGIQCIQGNIEQTGIFIQTPSLHIKFTNHTTIPVNGITLMDSNGNKMYQEVSGLTLEFLTQYGAYLVKRNKDLYNDFQKSENTFATKIKGIEDISRLVERDLSKALVTQTGLLNRADVIEHQLDLLGFIDGVNDKTDNLLTSFNDNNVLPITDGKALLKGNINLENTQINSMDCFIAGLPDAERDQKNLIRLKYGIIRTVIDFFHDYVSLAVEIYPVFLEFISKSYVNTDTGSASGIDSSILKEIDKIKHVVTTSGGNVSQSACKNLWSEYAIKYRQELSLGFFPVSEFGNMGSADIYKDGNARTEFTEEFDEICKDLKEKLGVEYFYIEAQNTPLATAFVKKGFGMITSNIAARDAAPGYSIKRAYSEGLPYKKSILIDRNFNENDVRICPNVTKPAFNDAFYGEKVLIENGPNCLISKFLGLSDMTVIANDKTNSIVSIPKFGDKSKRVVVDRGTEKKVTELGLNALIETTNVLTGSKFPQLRGSGKASKISQVKLSGMGGMNGLDSILIMGLKTYTDYCQTDEIEQLKTANARVIAASSDFLASRTFSDFFATPTVYVGVNHVTVTCSDTRYSTLTQDQLAMKLDVFNKLILYKDLIKRYIEQSIYYEYGYINGQQIATLSPSIYYGSNTLQLNLEQTIKNAYQTIDYITEEARVLEFNGFDGEQQMNFLKQFPDALSVYIAGLCKFKLSSQIFKETHDKITDIIFLIIAIPNRIDKEKFLDIFFKVEQELTNALPTNITPDDFNINLISIYTVAIATKTDHAKSSFVTNLREQIRSLSPSVLDEIRLKDIFEKMLDTIEFIFSLNKNIAAKLVTKLREQFIAVVPDVFKYETPSISSDNTELLNEIESVIPDIPNLAPYVKYIDSIDEKIENSQNPLQVGYLMHSKESLLIESQNKIKQFLLEKQRVEEAEKQKQKEKELEAIERASISQQTSQLSVDENNVNLVVPYSEVLRIITVFYNGIPFTSELLERERDELLGKISQTLLTSGGGGQKKQKTRKRIRVKKHIKTLKKRIYKRNSSYKKPAYKNKKKTRGTR